MIKTVCFAKRCETSREFLPHNIDEYVPRKEAAVPLVSHHQGLVAEIITMQPYGKNQHGTPEICNCSSQYGLVQIFLDTDYKIGCAEKNKCDRWMQSNIANRNYHE